MPLTVAALLSMPGLDELNVLAGRRHLSERTITWAHVIELADPTPWLQGGELVLTTGLGLGPAEDSQRDYARRLAGAGAAALGFGTGLSYQGVPPAVCAEADELGLPLFEVPRPVPFLAVTKAVAGRLAAEQYETVQRAVDAQRRLTSAALDRGMPGILAALIRLVPGWALVLDRRGQVLAAHPADAARKAEAVRAELSRHPARSTQIAISVAVADFNATIQSLGKGRSTWRGYLAVGQRHAPTPLDRLVVGHASSLVGLELQRSLSVRRAERRLRSDLLRTLLLALSGPSEMAGQLSRMGLPGGTVAVALLRWQTGYPEDVLDRVEDVLADLDVPGLTSEIDDGDVAVLLPGDGADAAQAMFHRLRQVTPGLRAGLGDEVTSGAAVTSLRQARQAVAVGRPGLVCFGSIGTFALLAGGNPAALGSLITRLLGRLRHHDDVARGELVRSLRVFLSHNGHWEAAADELGVHRHTLRYRMRKVEELTGRSLDSAQDRMEFWIALQAQDLLAGTGGGAIFPAESADEAGQP